MSNTTKIMAGLMLAAVAATAQAQPMRVKIADLDLTTKAGQDAFEARVRVAGATLCHDDFGPGNRAVCMQSVRDEAQEKLHAVLVARDSANRFAAR